MRRSARLALRGDVRHDTCLFRPHVPLAVAVLSMRESSPMTKVFSVRALGQPSGLRWARSLLPGLFVLSAAWPLSPAAVQAATVTWTNAADSGAGSLRQAIVDAASGDTITVGVTGTITLTSGELDIGKNLIISGPGTGQLTISGNNVSRIFFINPGAWGATTGPPATSPNVTISNLTLANGLAQGSVGGTANFAGGSGGSAGLGGAILGNWGELTPAGGILSSNQAMGGKIRK